jgi:uncharacterized protein (TIGR02145 family)
VNCLAIGYSGNSTGGKMKINSTLWFSPNSGATNSSGFSAFPTGARTLSGGYQSINGGTDYWTSNSFSSTFSLSRNLFYLYSSIGRYDVDKRWGITLRCLKD